jgi:hypothetical protein
MKFVTFEDQTSLYDATLFPQTYRRDLKLSNTGFNSSQYYDEVDAMVFA